MFKLFVKIYYLMISDQTTNYKLLFVLNNKIIITQKQINKTKKYINYIS